MTTTLLLISISSSSRNEPAAAAPAVARAASASTVALNGDPMSHQLTSVAERTRPPLGCRWDTSTGSA